MRAPGRDVEQNDVGIQRRRRGDDISNTGQLPDKLKIRFTDERLSDGRLHRTAADRGEDARVRLPPRPNATFGTSADRITNMNAQR